MGLLTKEVEIKLHSKNIKWFENKGYNIPRTINKYGNLTVSKGITSIKVKVIDLLDNSTALVDVQCDNCKEILYGMKWGDYKKYVHEDGKYYCNKCATKLLGKEKELITKLKNSISFYDWCYKNLSKEEANKIMLRWDYDLNFDKNGNVLTPMNITYKSQGINRKGYWFKCLENPEHESEQKRIADFTQGHFKSLNCNQCNSIATTHPELVKYLVNKKDAYENTFWTHKKILMKCPDCGCEKSIIPANLVNFGFGCRRCSDGISYPQKFMFNVLYQVNIDFITELNKTLFEWCKNYKYDFHIPKINGIVETHGKQHYEEPKGKWGKSDKIQENDRQKEQLAKENKIKNYIIIDCRESDMEWIKNSIMNSELPTLLNFKESDIDWLKCHEYACKSMVKTACDLWNKNYIISEIVDKLKIGNTTTRRYLKQGAKLGWCELEGRKYKNAL